jgi:hypothetical protein
MRALVLFLVCASAAPAQISGMHKTVFESRPAVALANDKLEVTILNDGGAFAALILRDDPGRLSPLWNPTRMMRELGTPRPQAGTGTGHFLCVDGFGPTSAEEKAAGLPGHGEAHTVPWEIAGVKEEQGIAVTFKASLPLVQELFTRTVRLVPGENVIYVDSELESQLGFDRPINWAEHATIGSPFLASGVTVVDISGTRSKTRPYQLRPGGLPHRLPPAEDFTWPVAPGVEGKGVNLRAAPATTNSGDHTTTLVDAGLKYGWITAIHPGQRLILGYIFRREEFPWVQNWENYPANGKLARGLEFGTQAFDVPRREAVTAGTLFDTPLYRWLPAKSKIATRFLFFYARTPEGMSAVHSLRLEGGKITLVDKVSGQRMTLEASQGL